jgi:ceramide glucosyltransferase
LLAAPADSAPVSLVIPVCGIDNYGEATLRSGFELDYPRYELIFCAARADDAAVPLVRRLMAEHPGVDARLLIGDEHVSPNPKLNNVVKGWDAAAHDWIAIADCNILMRHDYIQRLFATWRPDTGLVCSPPTGCLPAGFWAELECAFLNGYQARWQYLADGLGMGFAQGKTLFWRRSDLDAAGGIRALGVDAAEDAASTKIVREAGLRVRLVTPPARQPLGPRGAREVWRRQTRWARLRRATFPLYFAPEVLAGALAPMAALVFVAVQADWPVLPAAALFAALWYGGEFVLALAADWPVSRYFFACAVVRDLLMPVLWVDAWAGNQFEWRGTTMRPFEIARAAQE